jgi:hypothetical protein
MQLPLSGPDTLNSIYIAMGYFKAHDCSWPLGFRDSHCTGLNLNSEQHTH